MNGADGRGSPVPARRRAAGMIVLVVLAGAAALGRMMVGRDPVAGTIELAWPPASLVGFRATALAVGATVGAALGVSGALLQTLLRNPLASPSILGVSSGAALGVMVALWAGAGSVGEVAGGQGGVAILGAFGALGLVYLLAQRGGWLDPVTLVLVGVVVSTMCGAAIMLLQHLVEHGLVGDFVRWLMGRIPQAMDARHLLVAGGVTLAGVLVGAGLGPALDATMIGDDEARSVGVPLGLVRLVAFGLAGVLAAAAVALAGPIGFVGLLGPHAARLVLGPRNRTLVIGAALAGATVVVAADVLRQLIDLGGGRVPVGVFTAALGGPVLLWLLRTSRVEGA